MIGEFFDPQAELLVGEHFRPHWSQAGAIVYLTFRTQDSIPRQVILQWDRERLEWLRRHGLVVHDCWRCVVSQLTRKDRQDFENYFNRRREETLDECHGECHLRHPQFAKIVADSLHFFDEQRYHLGDFVIVPNHVHLLASFPNPEALRVQCDSWLHYTAWEINKRIGRSGSFWQEEPFDHLVRSDLQLEYFRQYIADNPKKAKLPAGSYLYCRG